MREELVTHVEREKSRMYPGGSWSQSCLDEPVVFKKIQVCVHVKELGPGLTGPPWKAGLLVRAVSLSSSAMVWPIGDRDCCRLRQSEEASCRKQNLGSESFRVRRNLGV